MSLRVATIAGLLTASSACVFETDLQPEGATDGGTCGGARCSVHGFCRDGECVCETGYLGDPYARLGCQPSNRESVCATTCGLNAYCQEETAECRCVEGFAACGTGDCVAAERICDGVEDCPAGGDEGTQRCMPSVEQVYVVTDGCNDERPVQFRLWAEQRDWVWPGPDDVFETVGLGVSVAQSIECVEGELVCIGARAGDRAYGVDLDASLTCEDCCFVCDWTTVDFGVLDC